MLFEEQVTSLLFAVRIRVVVAYIARMMQLVAGAGLAPLVVMLAVGDLGPALAMAACVAVMMLVSLCKRLTATADLQRNEALVISASLILIPSIVFLVPMRAYGLPPDDALFESVSGITSTGLTVIDHPERHSYGLLFLRAWSQWLGGLGIIILFLGIAVESGLATRQLGLSEDLRQDPLGGIRTHAKQATLTYGVLTLAALLTLWACGLSLAEAPLYALTAVSTAGFTPTGQSLGTVGTAATIGVFLFCVLGALPLHAYYRSVLLNRRALLRDLQVRGLLMALVVSVGLVFALNQWPDGTDLATRLSQSASLGVSAQTTSGFTNDATPADLSDSGKLALIGPMLVGGGLGSTAGGIKILRLLLILRVLEWLFIRLSVPASARIEPRLGGHPVGTDELQAGMLILLIMLATIGGSTLAFVHAGYDPVDALFDVTSAMGTVGLSAGVVGPELSTPLKLLLCGNMLLGRLETIALIVLLFPWTWLGRRRETP